MPSQTNRLTLFLAAALLTPSVALAGDNFSYDFYEVEISSTTDHGESYTSLGGNGSMEINDNHYITAKI